MIIICHHAGRLIDKCITSIGNNKAIVMTSDLSLWKEKHNYPNAEITYTINNPCYKRNQGISKTNDKYICFLDDDIELIGNCLAIMQDFLDKHKEVGMVFATLYKPDGAIDNQGCYLSNTGFIIEETDSLFANMPVLSGKSACCMLRKDVFKKVDGFDEDFFIYCEETDLAWRIWLKGYEVWQLNHARATHYAETSYKPDEYYNKKFIFYHGCKNYITMLIKNLGWRNLYIVLVNFMVWFLVGIIFLFKRYEYASYIFKGLTYNLVNLPLIWAKRHKIQKERAKTDKQLFPFVFYNPPISYYLQRLGEYLFQNR